MQVPVELCVEDEAAKAVRAELEAEGYEVEFWLTGPGSCLVGLYLREDGLLAVTRGEALVEADGRRLSLAPGDRALVPQGTTYGVVNQGNGLLGWLVATRATGRNLALR